MAQNKLFYGDNLEVLRKYIKDETVDLCYIDPPFNSKRNYNQIYNNIGKEDQAQAQAFIELGFKLGFGGAMTFERALQIRRLAADLPAEALVLETDAPDIPPHWLYTTAQDRQSGIAQGRNAPQGMVGGALSAMLQPMGAAHPEKHTSDSLIRYDQMFLVAELVFIAIFLINLHTSSASHAVAAQLIMSGPYALAFWGGVVGVGVLLPLVWQGLELAHRIGHTVVPAVLVLAGGFTLRWIMVNAGQVSEIVPVVGMLP